MPLQKRVVDLPAVTGVTGTDLLIMSSSSATKRVSVSQIGEFFTAAGVAGPTGVQGDTGPNSIGPTGATGGIAFAATGTTAPTLDAAGSIWLDTDTGRYFVRYADVFLEVGVQGERGPTGSAATGPTGIAGSIGATGAAAAYQAATAPESAVAGATWLDVDTGQYFVRYDGVWIEVGGKHYP